MSYRIYIDESGDHNYEDLDTDDKRYLGITGVVIRKADYNPAIADRVASLKRTFFHHDPDEPLILVRKRILQRQGSFWVLRDANKNTEWETALLSFYGGLRAKIFTVVIDKEIHKARFAHDIWNPYVYSLQVLLNRIKGWLAYRSNGTADIMPESRGKVEDAQLKVAYQKLRNEGDRFFSATEFCATYPNEQLLFKRKEDNIAGNQIADLIVHEQRRLTLIEKGRITPNLIPRFGDRLNAAIGDKVNQYGRVFLE